jgi:hypothetical protein
VLVKGKVRKPEASRFGHDKLSFITCCPSCFFPSLHLRLSLVHRGSAVRSLSPQESDHVRGALLVS